MAKDSIYVTGWEYNRILSEDPTQGVQSGLPAGVLYQGSSQFWLFKKIYCTKESLESELQSAELLGWAQGKIFRDLVQDGFLTPYEWSDFKKDGGARYRKFTQAHAQLKSEFSRKRIGDLIDAGDSTRLESIKVKLLAPLCEHLNCIADITPDATVHWASKGTASTQTSNSSEALDLIASPVVRNGAELKMGMSICDRPGSRASPQEIFEQTRIVQTIELPRMPKLLMGDMPQADYLQELLPYANVYRPITAHMLEDWERSRARLNRLRDLAAKHIWPDLHSEWLPRLEEDPSFYREIGKLVRDALVRCKMASYLDPTMRALIIGSSTAVGLAANVVGGPFAGVALGKWTEENLRERYKESLLKSDKLTLFYQAAKRTK